MEVFLFEPEKYARLYNCSWYSVEAVPLEVRRSPLLGAGLLALATLFTACYLPCAVAIGRHLEHSCYKIMFALAWWDMVSLVEVGIFVGYFAIRGMVFCSSPTLMYLNGSAAFMSWLGESTLAILLALDRYAEILMPRMADLLFTGWRTWLWVAAAICYAVVGMFFSGGFSFSGVLFSYFGNPHAGYYPEWYKDKKYHYSFHFVHNLSAAIILIGLYTSLFLGLLFKRARATIEPAISHATIHVNSKARHNSQQTTQSPNISGRWESRILVQVILISLANAMTASLFISFQMFAVPPWLIYAGTYAWICAHGVPSLIYLKWNTIIRGECKKMFGRIWKTRNLTTSSRAAAAAARAKNDAAT